jgi:hypothetical protein
MWTRFLVVSFILVADLGGVWESTADTGKTERLFSGAQCTTPFSITGSVDSKPPFTPVLCGAEVLRSKLQATGQTFFYCTVVRNPSLADPYYSRAPHVLA